MIESPLNHIHDDECGTPIRNRLLSQTHICIKYKCKVPFDKSENNKDKYAIHFTFVIDIRPK